MSDPREIVAAIRKEVEAAVDVILTAAADGLQALPAIQAGDASAASRLELGLLQILEACAFQDLTGQRLACLDAALETGPPAPGSADPLVNGPALDGQGLDQAAADRVLSEFWMPARDAPRR